MPEGTAAGDFAPTAWSVVLRAKDPDDPGCRAALERLCATYWEPVYVYVRRRGSGTEDARDLTQGFFAHLLEKGLLERVERGRGRFRSYLLAVLSNYLANERRLVRAGKRGGGAAPRSLDLERAESDARFEPADPETPDAAFRRSWAVSVLEAGLETLGRELEARGRRAHFEALRDHLAAAGTRPSYAELAARLGSGTTVADVTNILHRARVRLREIVRSRLRDGVENEAELEDEVKDLFAAFERKSPGLTS